MIKMHSGC